MPAPASMSIGGQQIDAIQIGIANGRRVEPATRFGRRLAGRARRECKRHREGERGEKISPAHGAESYRSRCARRHGSQWVQDWQRAVAELEEAS